jgi:serine/threonine protein kinase
VTNDPPTPAPIARPAGALFVRDEILDNNYRIIEGLAAGGMGEVYRAVHLRLPRTLAIKTMNLEFAARPEWVARFCREAKILAQLRHPNIVQVLDFNIAPNGVPYLAMELLEGQDLRAAIDAGRRFDAAETAAIVRQVASALDAAHAAGVVHRDLKPENVVLLSAPGQLPVVKVIDFGLSLRGGSDRVTADHSIIGTPDYMAPEQAQGLREQIDARTDQFALAALAYTLLTGRTPFSRDTPVAILYAVVHEEPAELGRPWGGTPRPSSASCAAAWPGGATTGSPPCWPSPTRSRRPWSRVRRCPDPRRPRRFGWCRRPRPAPRRPPSSRSPAPSPACEGAHRHFYCRSCSRGPCGAALT